MHSVKIAVLCVMNITVFSQYPQCLLLNQPMLFTQVCILVCNCLPSLTELRMASQGVVTPIGAILKAATGTRRSHQAMEVFFRRSQSHEGFQDGSKRSQAKASRFKRNVHDPFYAVVTRTRAILRCGHGVTAKFRRTQIVSPVTALSIAPMGVTTPCFRVRCGWHLLSCRNNGQWYA